MRQLSKKTRLQADSDPAVAGRFVRAVLDASDAGIKFGGRVVRPGPLLNALAVWWMSHPEPQRLKIAREALAQLETALADGPNPALPGAGEVITPGEVIPVPPRPTKPARRRRA